MTKKPEHHGRTMTVEVSTSADPERAYAAFARPEHVTGWFCDSADGVAEAGAELTWHFDIFDFDSVMHVLEAVENERLLLASPEIPDMPRLVAEVRIERKGAGSVIRLVNSGFKDGSDWDEEYEGVRSGWQLALRLLAHYIEEHYGAGKRMVLAVRPIARPYTEVAPYFRDADKLAWLGASEGGIGAEGSTYEIDLGNGNRASGRVLGVSDRGEVALTWEERSGALELKMFSFPGMGAVGALRATLWSASEQDAAEVQTILDAAIERLPNALG